MTTNERRLGRNVAWLVARDSSLTRAYLARQLGVSVQAIGQLLRGETKGLKPLNLVHLARCLHVTAEALVLQDLSHEPTEPATRVRETASTYTADSLPARVRTLIRQLSDLAAAGRLPDAALDFIERAVELETRAVK